MPTSPKGERDEDDMKEGEAIINRACKCPKRTWGIHELECPLYEDFSGAEID